MKPLSQYSLDINLLLVSSKVAILVFILFIFFYFVRYKEKIPYKEKMSENEHYRHEIHSLKNW